MQSEINLGGKRVLAGLQWHVVSKDKAQRSKDARLAKDQAKKANLQYSLTYEGEKLAAIGFGSKPSTATSAAALLAEANARFVKQQAFGDSDAKSNWIVVEKIQKGEGQGLYWLGAVLDGVPAPLGDTVDDFNVISAKIADLMDLMESPEIFSTDPDLQDYVADVAPATPKGFADLVEGATLKTARLRKTGGVPKQVIYAGVAVLAIFAVYGATSFYVDWRAQQQRIAHEQAQREELARMAKQAAAQSEQQARELTKKAIETAMAQVVSALSQGAPSARLSSWIATMESVTFEHGNWAITKSECDGEACAVSLAREAYGTNDSLLAARKDATLNGDTATFSLPLLKSQSEADAANPPRPASAPAAASAASGASAASAVEALAAPRAEQEKPAQDLGVLLGTRDQFIRGLASDLQMLRNVGLSYDVTADQPVTYRPVAANPQAAAKPGTPNTTEMGPVPLGISQGKFTLRGDGMWMLSGVEKILNRPGLTVEAVKFGAPSSMSDGSWTLAGTYYLATGDGPATAGKKPQEEPASAGPMAAATGVADVASGASAGSAPVPGTTPLAPPAAASGVKAAPLGGPVARAAAPGEAPALSQGGTAVPGR